MIFSNVKGSPDLRPGRFLVEKLVAQEPFRVIKLNCCWLHQAAGDTVLDATDEVECLHIALAFAFTRYTQLGVMNFKHDDCSNCERLGGGIIPAAHCCYLREIALLLDFCTAPGRSYMPESLPKLVPMPTKT